VIPFQVACFVKKLKNIFNIKMSRSSKYRKVNHAGPSTSMRTPCTIYSPFQHMTGVFQGWTYTKGAFVVLVVDGPEGDLVVVPVEPGELGRRFGSGFAGLMSRTQNRH
jgi:hypothetical protein